MDRFHVSGWRRWLNELVSEGATLGTVGLVVVLALAVPAFRETSDDDWLKKSELAVTFLDRYGNEVGSRGIKHNDAIPLDQFPDHLIKAVLSTEDRRFYEHFGIDLPGTARALVANTRAGGVVQGGSSHHAAARQEPVPQQRAHDRAQGQGSLPRHVAGIAPDQERDPQALSRPRLYGRRHLRRRRSGAVLFQQVGARREPLGSGHARRPVQGAHQVRAAHQPAGGARARQRRARQPGRSQHDDRRPGVRRPPQSGNAGRPARRSPAQLLSRLGLRRDEEAGRHLPEVDERARVRGAHRARHQLAEQRRHGDRECRCGNTARNITPSNPPPC